MSKFRCQEGKVADEIVVNAMTDERRSFGQIVKRVAVPMVDNIFIPEHTLESVQSDKSINDGSGVFRMIFPEVDKLKYVPEKLDDIELEVRFKTVGVNNVNSEAINELQVKGSFASMESS
jgi:hypothetical protein